MVWSGSSGSVGKIGANIALESCLDFGTGAVYPVFVWLASHMLISVTVGRLLVVGSRL